MHIISNISGVEILNAKKKGRQQAKQDAKKAWQRQVGDGYALDVSPNAPELRGSLVQLKDSAELDFAVGSIPFIDHGDVCVVDDFLMGEFFQTSDFIF